MAGVKTLPNKDIRASRRRVWLRLAVLLVGLTAVVLGCRCLVIFGYRHLFVRNPRFAVEAENIIVESTGYFGRSAGARQLMARMIRARLAEKADRGAPVTIFSDTPGELRHWISRIFPSIASARVERVLPGSLSVKLTERIPRAFINSSGSTLLIDDDGVLMDRRFCVFNASELPVIETGVSGWQVGDNTARLRPALELLATARGRYPELGIYSVTAVDEKSIRFNMTYRGGSKRYHVLMKPENFDRNLLYLSSACEQAVSSGMTHNIANMLYDVGVTWQSQ